MHSGLRELLQFAFEEIESLLLGGSLRVLDDLPKLVWVHALFVTRRTIYRPQICANINEGFDAPAEIGVAV